MKSMSIYALVLTLGLASMATAEDGHPVKGADDVAAPEMNRFAFDLYAELAKSPDSNILLSPASISQVLKIIHAGTANETAAEFESVLHLGPLAVAPAVVTQMPNPEGEDKPEGKDKPEGQMLLDVSHIWVADGYPLIESYLKNIQDQFKAAATPISFQSPDEAAQAINAWVAARSNGKVEQLFNTADLDINTVLVAANVVDFAGAWRTRFDPAATLPNAPFTDLSGKSVMVPLMRQTARLRYAEFKGFQVLELPYEGGDLAMDILLPENAAGLATLEGLFNAQNVQAWLSRLEQKEVEVSLPRFNLDARVKLKETLQKLGLRRAFDVAESDFSRMTDKENLYLSTVVHQVTMEVDEKGTKATAATGAAVGARFATARPVFKADHPFLFLVRNTKSGSIQFLGRFGAP